MHAFLTKDVWSLCIFVTYPPGVSAIAAAGCWESAARQTVMALLHQESSLGHSTCVRSQGNDLRHLLPHPPSNKSRSVKRPLSSRIHVEVAASTPPQVFGRQSPGLLIQQPTSQRSGCFAKNIVHSFQSDAPLEQQIDPPPPSPKFQPFTPQVCLFAAISSIKRHARHACWPGTLQTGVRQDMLNYRHKVQRVNWLLCPIWLCQCAYL